MNKSGCNKHICEECPLQKEDCRGFRNYTSRRLCMGDGQELPVEFPKKKGIKRGTNFYCPNDGTWLYTNVLETEGYCNVCGKWYPCEI